MNAKKYAIDVNNSNNLEFSIFMYSTIFFSVVLNFLIFLVYGRDLKAFLVFFTISFFFSVLSLFFYIFSILFAKKGFQYHYPTLEFNISTSESEKLSKKYDKTEDSRILYQGISIFLVLIAYFSFGFLIFNLILGE